MLLEESLGRIKARQPVIHIGIDVSNAHLDIDTYPGAAPKRYANDEAGRTMMLVTRLSLSTVVQYSVVVDPRFSD